MGEKKRKSLDALAEAPSKKSKKGDATDVPTQKKSKKIETTDIVVPTAAAVSKQKRKRAADFLDDDEDAGGVDVPAAQSESTKPSKKSKKKQNGSNAAETLTADGSNGVVEHAGDEHVETITKAPKKTKSMQQEAQDTVDKEIEDEFAAFSEDDNQSTKIIVDPVGSNSDDDEGTNIDTTAALLTGLDSDSDDDAADTGDLTRTPALPDYKKTTKKLRQAKEQKSGEDTPGTIYVGRIPHGFYEPQMRAFFTQFGDITRLRLARNKHTAASKHFAFIEFASSEVAKIAAAAMDNYLMFGHILKCKYVEAEALHPDTFKGANRKYRKIPHVKLEGKRLAEAKSVEAWSRKNEKEKHKRQKKAKLLKEKMGYDAPSGRLVDPADVVAAAASKQAQIEEKPVEERKEIADVAATNGIANGTSKEKKAKKDKKAVKDQTYIADAVVANGSAQEKQTKKAETEVKETKSEPKDKKKAKKVKSAAVVA
ncbi:putative RNA-binding protein [Cyphellophora attinorum]|uniref:Putative RNA-binding protein n=1 Tax=Cyphellophora attinorum TaxID=1664694 RepID=A0A0N1H118_9EURO|nr:putative RNA-binding protein [Phialophora attinorum]KPI34310.1 putative RNA-binding protein [Phialophora attinorum]